MSTFTLFMIEITLCLGISVVVIYLLKPLLQAVLIETCGTEPRAAFWVMFTQIMLVISPLLIVIYFAPIQGDAQINAAEAIKDTLFRSLLGNFLALTLIGQVIWKSIQRAHQLSSTKPDHEPDGQVA